MKIMAKPNKCPYCKTKGSVMPVASGGVQGMKMFHYWCKACGNAI